MTEHYQLNELEIDEISLVDQGANEGAKIVLTKRDDEIVKRLETVEIEKAALLERVALQEIVQKARALWPHLAGSDETKTRVLKSIEAMEDEPRRELHGFFAAADAALAQAMVEKGVTKTGHDDPQDEEAALHHMASDFAAQNNLSLPVAKKRLVSENKEAAALFKRVLARVQKRNNSIFH